MIEDGERSRREAVEAAIGSARIEGVVLAPEAVALFETFIAGEIDADRLMARALALWGPQEKSPPG